MRRRGQETADPQREAGPPALVALARRVAMLRGLHRKCRVPACKRVRQCVGPLVRCLRDHPVRRPAPTRVLARHLAAIRRAARSAPETPS